MKTAVIDIGTNTLLLLVIEAEHGNPGSARVLADECEFGRLGQGLDSSGALAHAAITRSLDICRRYRAIIDAHHVDSVHIVATQALREASNAALFREPAEQLLGATIEIIAGEREAGLAFSAVVAALPALAGTPYVVVDVGGGSTEFITTDGARVVSAVSIPIGAVRLTERHLKSDPPTAAEIAALHADIDARLASIELPKNVPLVGTAGTATTMAALALQLLKYDPDKITGVRLAPADVATQSANLLAATTAARRILPGMEAARADVVAAGVAIFARAVVHMQSPTMIVCDRGIRWGVANEVIKRGSPIA